MKNKNFVFKFDDYDVDDASDKFCQASREKMSRVFEKSKTSREREKKKKVEQKKKLCLREERKEHNVDHWLTQQKQC